MIKLAIGGVVLVLVKLWVTGRGENQVPDNGNSDDANGIKAGFQRISTDEAISSFVLECIKVLNDTYPQPVDTLILAEELGIGSVGEKALDLFREPGIISGPKDRTVLTLRGLKLLMSASKSDFKIAQFLSGKPVGDSSAVLLALLRADFYD